MTEALAKILVADDEPDLRALLQRYLSDQGYSVRTVDGAGPLDVLLQRERFDVLVLDVMMPEMDGFEVCMILKSNPDTAHIPVIMVTALDTPEERIRGLEAGADDYVTKPFSLEEVVARVRALLRRSVQLQAEESSLLRVGDLTLDEDSHEVMRGGDEITLTATEFELLRFLMRNPKRVLSKAQILDRVWHYDFGGQANVVELYISYLRKKIDAGRDPMIHTMRGAGYVLKPAGVSAGTPR